MKKKVKRFIMYISNEFELFYKRKALEYIIYDYTSNKYTTRTHFKLFNFKGFMIIINLWNRIVYI